MIRRRSISGETEPGTWTSVNRSASGKSSQKTSRQRSPPRIPVSQSWISATRMAIPGSDSLAGDGGNPPAPVVEELAERLLEGDLHLPARGPVHLGGIALEHHDIRGAEPGGIGLDLDPLHRGLLQQEVEHLLNGPGAAGAEIVHLAGLAALEQEPVPAHDIAHVGVVPARREVAHVHDRLAEPRLDLGYLLGE